MYIERFLEQKIKEYLGKKEIIAIVGARQCGKTTLMRHVFNQLKNARFLSFDDVEVLELFSQDVKSFVDVYVRGADYLFIDEFQYAKDGGKQLKYIYDNFDIKMIISGSSAPDLSVQSIKYLVGRIFVFTLYPLSFEEFLRYKDNSLYELYLKESLSSPVVDRINRHYDEFLVYGGYPRVVTARNHGEKEEVLRGIYNTYLLKEIKEILQLPDDFKLSRLIKILALQAGGIANYEELSSSTGCDYHELLKYLNILQKTFVCIESRPFFTNKKKELVKAPKIFFLDSGFRNFVIKNFQAPSERTDLGALNENFAASEIAKLDVELKYWRTKAKAEVDFVVEAMGGATPIEVKSLLNGPDVTRSFRNFVDEYKPKSSFVLSQGYVGKKRLGNTDVQFYPLFFIGQVLERVLNV